ncbi:potassium-transporting ATPase subunit C [Actinomycetospora sp. TBRC 11914]|uniref:potassium-transporting ATPase subunit C n=1 Tax=Actinomycetospora sp. TBRC 11914 TaxID=2729387 RepID=UPI00145D490B|nr:potassium-transporting ATPase subunit C [Actinomycetospora sp. TBRC 11914]NMO88496.1 potassium-transporting ATPase subunit C [Actinomycetospora sp. TBRC 11914]
MSTLREHREHTDTTDEPTPVHPVTGSALRRQGLAALRLLVVLTILLGVAYPLGIWVVSRVPGLHDQAEGSLMTADGTATGSSLIGIDPVPADPSGATDPWFHTRPSASAPDSATAGLGPADPSTSGGSNEAADSDGLVKAVGERRAAIAAREGVDPAAVPPDAVTASGSGLDPDISPAYAALQVPRVARVTGLGPDRVRALVEQATSGRTLGFLGEPTVNVSELDALVHGAAPSAR